MLQYIFQSIITLGMFYLVYFFIIRNEKTFVFNRVYILLALLAGVISPFIHLPLTNNSNMVPSMHYYMDELVIAVEGSVDSRIWIRQHKWMVLYLSISVIMLFHLIRQFIQIHKMKSPHFCESAKKYNIVYTSGKIAHFSFFKHVFINRQMVDSSEEMARILKHEEAHVQQWHSIDIVLLEILKIFFWFNPFIWLFKPCMLNNHEYLADHRVISLGEDKTEYIGQIVNSSLTNLSKSLVHNFNYTLTKKRIVMMTKQQIKWLSGIKMILIVPFITGLILFFSCTENPPEEVQQAQVTKTNQDDFFYVVEKMPTFNGAGAEGFKSYIADNLEYPKEALTNGIEGKVYIEFVVGGDGSVKNVTIARGVHPLLDNEALRVVNTSPKWVPGEQRGEKVNVKFTFPIKFELK